MKRFFLMATLTSCITMLSVTAACAYEKTNTWERVKRESHVLLNNVSAGGSGNGTTSTFVVPKDEGMVKVHYHNNGNVNVRITVDKDHTEKMTASIAPGQRWTGYSNKAFSTGTHSVQVYSPNGDAKGTLSVRVGTTINAIKS